MVARSNVVPFSGPTPMTTWPVPGDAPDLQTIVHDQAQTIKDKAVLIAAYQAWLNSEQAPVAPLPTAYANATASGTPATTLTITNVANGTIVIGAVVAGPGVPTGVTIVSQQSGTGGLAGVYTTSAATTASSAQLTFTPPPNPMPWPTPTDAPTLTTIMMDQTSILRSQTALIQQYQILLNDSQTPAPPTGP